MKNSDSTKKFDLAKFEKLSSKGDVLKGGFSTAFSGGLGDPILGPVNANIGDCSQTTNNCHGANCVAGCGGK